ncbi:HAD-IA family hydrolase [Patescibacteria group bacterium]
MKIEKRGKDQDRSGVTFSKIKQLFKLLLPKNLKTLSRINKFNQLDPRKFEKKEGIKIKGIITDVDECISLNRGEILEENVEHLKKLLKQGYPIVFLSNMEKTNRYEVIPKEIKIMTNFPSKPAPEGFLKALNSLEIKKEEAIMVGDNYITDGGAIPLGIRFVKVKPIFSTNESRAFRILRLPVNTMRWFYDWLSRFYERKSK